MFSFQREPLLIVTFLDYYLNRSRKSSLGYLTCSPIRLIWISNSATCTKTTSSSTAHVSFVSSHFMPVSLQDTILGKIKTYIPFNVKGLKGKRAVQWSKKGRNLLGGNVQLACRQTAGTRPRLPERSPFAPRGHRVTSCLCWYCKKLCLLYDRWRVTVSIFLRNSTCFHFASPCCHDLHFRANREETSDSLPAPDLKSVKSDKMNTNILETSKMVSIGAINGSG